MKTTNEASEAVVSDAPTILTCTKCKEQKALSEFTKDSGRAHGVRKTCRICAAVRQLEYNHKNMEAVRGYRRKSYNLNRERYAERAKATASRRRGLLMVRGAKTRAKQQSLPYDLDSCKHEIQRRVDAGYCELTGIPFYLHGSRRWDTPSIDRIVPENGYVYSNVRVVCRAINCMLGNWGPEVMEKVFDDFIRTRDGGMS